MPTKKVFTIKALKDAIKKVTGKDPEITVKLKNRKQVRIDMVDVKAIDRGFLYGYEKDDEVSFHIDDIVNIV